MAAVGGRDERRPPAAGVVAGALALDLDHVGAEIGQNLPGPRPRQDAGKLKHAQTGQRTRHRKAPLTCGARRPAASGNSRFCVRRRKVVHRSCPPGRFCTICESVVRTVSNVRNCEGFGAVNTSFFGEMLQTIAERGRALLDRTRNGRERRARNRRAALRQPGRALRGTVVGPRRSLGRGARARDPHPLRGIDHRPPHRFFEALAEGFGPDHARLDAAIAAWRAAPSDATAADLHRASEPRRQELFRRLNLAPGGTAALVRMREQLIDALDHREDLAAVDAAFNHLFSSWFNRGFLVLRRIDWSSPAIVLEKIIRYEAVHRIRGWDDLRRRIDPPDRRCYAFFHPALVDDPLIFVEVALTSETPVGDRADPHRAARRDRAGQGDHGGVLFDLELPARAHRRLLRPFPDQAGGRGDRARKPSSPPS